MCHVAGRYKALRPRRILAIFPGARATCRISAGRECPSQPRIATSGKEWVAREHKRLGRLQRTLPKPDKYYDSAGRKSTEAADGQRARASERRPGSWVRPWEGVAGRSGLAGEVGGVREVL